MSEIVSTLQNALSSFGFIPSLVVFAIIGMYIFWSESHSTRKDRNSVFDVFFLTLLVTIIWGRFSYILSNPGDFEGLVWSVVPYEKYSDGIYYFRLLPWKYMKIWDGGFLFISMYAAFTIVGFIVSTYIKKWRWREMIGVITISGTVMLGASLIVTGLLGDSDIIVRQGAVVIGIYLLYLILHRLVKQRFKGNQDMYEKSIFILHFGYFVLSNTFILLSLLLSQITQVDRYNLYSLIVFMLISTWTFIADMQRKNIVLDTVARTPKLPKVGSIVKVKKK